VATAISLLNCTYYNAPRTVVVTCANGTTQSIPIPARQFSSTKSQDDANALADQESQKAGVSACDATVGAYTVGNTDQFVPYSFTVTTRCGTSYPYSGTMLIPANVYTAQTTSSTDAQTKARLNQQAFVLAQQNIRYLQASFTTLRNAECWHITSPTGIA